MGSEGEFSWGVVIPVKRLALAKTRLAAYGDQHREALALAFAADVVVAALLIGTVVVVTDDERAGPVLAALGARVVADDPDAGLNPALEHGAELLRADNPLLAVAWRLDWSGPSVARLVTDAIVAGGELR